MKIYCHSTSNNSSGFTYSTYFAELNFVGKRTRDLEVSTPKHAIIPSKINHLCSFISFIVRIPLSHINLSQVDSLRFRSQWTSQLFKESLYRVQYRNANHLPISLNFLSARSETKIEFGYCTYSIQNSKINSETRACT